MNDDLSQLTNDELDARLIAERKASREKWPYTGTSEEVRRIEGEYIVRRLVLPEFRAKEND